ncbi:MAG: 16S rRNA (cytosine(1402)-N(4))-methyltransferase [Clostridium fessum]
MLSIRLQNFCTIDEIAKEAGGFDFILADLGVSSMQIDNPKRGFSFKVDGPLDLRLNQQKGISAAERLDTIEQRGAGRACCMRIQTNRTARSWRKPSRMRSAGDIVMDTTTKLREIIEKTSGFPSGEGEKETVKKTCQRVFQALRIDVNQEFEVLYEFMEKLPGAFEPGGRAAILTFHSGEDKLVKRR